LDKIMDAPLIVDILSEHFLSVEPDCLLSDAIQMMHKQKSSCIIVAKDRIPKGIITESDVVGLFAEALQGANWSELKVDHVMTAAIISASSDLDVLEAIIIAQGGRVRHIPVTDENGLLLGVANQTELVQSLVDFCRRGDLW
jgi:CBS domain-containing protein